MSNKLEILIPEIFPVGKIISGVTLKNEKLLSLYGLTVSKGAIFSDEEVIRHRLLLAESINVPFESMKYQQQVHGANIRLIDIDSPETESDGMLTQVKGIVLNVKIADCAAILLFDPVTESIGAIHSGWRGTAANIAKKSIEAMQLNFDVKPENLLAFISPCASGDVYEVGEDVASHFTGFVKSISSDKYLFDNKSCIFNQLVECGVQPGNIEVSPVCTISDTNYHSYRRDKENSGRSSAFIGIKAIPTC